MAKQTKKRGANIVVVLLALLLGLAGGFVATTYFTLPQTEEIVVSQQTFYSFSNATVSSSPVELKQDELSIHFLELGNKYTGDCTYIKYGNTDILIDCGSKSNSVATVANYLNQYVQDNTLEYVIVTHAHTDHIAGFATSAKVDSIFDLYVCNNIIDFGTATGSNSNTYKNYVRERTAEIEAGANYFEASSITQGNNKVFEIDNHFKFEVLFNAYQFNKNATTENDYSVCTLFTFNEQHFLFTGDLEEKGEAMLVQNNPCIQKANLPNGVEIFKAGHHGSKTSSTEELLKNIRPQNICVCCCAGSPEYTATDANQFPTQAFVDRASAYTKNIYVTTLCLNWETNEFCAMNGNIVFIFEQNGNAKSHFSNNSTLLKDTQWFAAHRTWHGVL